MDLFSDEWFMREALKEAEIALSKHEVPIGAVIVIQQQIIARSHNLTETLHDPTAHAEMQAYTAATNFLGSKYLKDCTLYVTVEPCPMCAGGAFWTQIGRIVYGASDTKRGYSTISSNMVHPITKVVGGVLAEECGKMVSDFFAQKRK